MVTNQSAEKTMGLLFFGSRVSLALKRHHLCSREPNGPIRRRDFHHVTLGPRFGEVARSTGKRTSVFDLMKSVCDGLVTSRAGMNEFTSLTGGRLRPQSSRSHRDTSKGWLHQSRGLSNTTTWICFCSKSLRK